jgi:hypothetical protein
MLELRTPVLITVPRIWVPFSVADAEHTPPAWPELTASTPVFMTVVVSDASVPSGGLDRVAGAVTVKLATFPVTSTLYDEAAHVVHVVSGEAAAPALATERMAGVAQTTAPPTAALLRKVRRP